MIKSKNVIERMKTLEQGVTVLRGVLSTAEITALKNYNSSLLNSLNFQHLQRDRAINGPRKNQIINVPDDEHYVVDNLIRDKLQLLPFKYESMNFYKIQNPYHLHSDTGKDNAVGYQQGLIPLEIDTVGSLPTTVLFNERVYFSSEYVPIDKRIIKAPTYQPFYNIGTWEPTNYEGWVDEYRMTDDECKRIWYGEWKHWKECYKGFSVHTIYEWKLGDILLFDRSLLHASGLLSAGGINFKSGLLFLTYMD